MEQNLPNVSIPLLIIISSLDLIFKQTCSNTNIPLSVLLSNPPFLRMDSNLVTVNVANDLIVFDVLCNIKYCNAFKQCSVVVINKRPFSCEEILLHILELI